MRNMIFWSALLLAGVISPPASANELNVQQHNAQSSLLWRDAGSVLGLESDASSGIVVTRAGPEGTWGLQRGDVILAVDGHPVHQIAALVERLRASKPAAVKIQVRRAHAGQELTLAAKDYDHLIAPKPPVPPQPPATPAAPLPPPPPPAPISGG